MFKNLLMEKNKVNQLVHMLEIIIFEIIKMEYI